MSYKKLGNLVRFISKKNTDEIATVLYGINIDKFFMPSVANTIGVDLKKYKVVDKYQFACNRMHVGRDERLPISMSTYDYPFIVSPAYDVFEVIDTNVVIPEYLMLWFRRGEFDRQCWFYTDADVRGGLHLDALKAIEIEIPTIEKQRVIVAQYEAVAKKIKVNEGICEKLEASAQALYKQWFVDFEFPITKESHPELFCHSELVEESTTKSYKSSGGKMIFNEELEKEIPESWEVGTLGDICEFIDGDRGSNYPNGSDFTAEGFCLFLNAGNVTKKGFDFNVCSFITEQKDNQLRKGKLKRGDIIITSRGTVGNIAFYSNFIKYDNIRINSGMLILRPQIKESFIYSLLRSYEFTKLIENYISGSAVPQLPIKDLSVISILKASEVIMNNFSEQAEKIYNIMDSINNQNQKLSQLQNLLLSRLAMLEGETNT
ncbi:restriction endonuclease subunit S [Empedobacter brevis]|uniref:restriction endonuclease subunit S n=1 Tax=Empedobacter brevis TaxID=247 RepID=UPI0028A77FB3|nr:restriction endonuclease subunit S [Empedobacter brevis]